MLKMLKKLFLGPKVHFGVKRTKKCISAFLRFLTSGAFIWAYYSNVSCVLAEASELSQKFCRVATLCIYQKKKNMNLHKLMIHVKVIRKSHARP